jgi:hypothetical protein
LENLSGYPGSVRSKESEKTAKERRGKNMRDEKIVMPVLFVINSSFIDNFGGIMWLFL